MKNPIIIDTETTGLRSPEAIEVAYIELNPDLTMLKHRLKTKEIERYKLYSERFMPSKSIEDGASKVHSIYKKDLIKCRKSNAFSLPEHSYFIAHNANFDYRVLGKPETTLICTKQIAEIALDGRGNRNHKLVTLVDFFFEKEEADRMVRDAHGALADCIMTLKVLVKLLEFLPHIKTFEDLAKLTTQPKDAATKVLEKIPFGKHKGKKFSEVPKDYLVWLYKQNPSQEIKNSIEKVLK